MQNYTRREILQTWGRLSAGIAMGTAGHLLSGCAVDSDPVDRLPAEALVPVDLEKLKLTVLYDNCCYN